MNPETVAVIQLSASLVGGLLVAFAITIYQLPRIVRMRIESEELEEAIRNMNNN